MVEGIGWVVFGLVGGLGLFLVLSRWFQARAGQSEPDTSFFSRVRWVGGAARLLCGILAILMIWAGIAEPEVSVFYAALGSVIFLFNLFLYVPWGRPKS